MYRLRKYALQARNSHNNNHNNRYIASTIHAKNNGLIPQLETYWPNNASVDEGVRGMLLPWAVMTGVIGTLAWASFFLTHSEMSAKKEKDE